MPYDYEHEPCDGCLLHSHSVHDFGPSCLYAPSGPIVDALRAVGLDADVEGLGGNSTGITVHDRAGGELTIVDTSDLAAPCLWADGGCTAEVILTIDPIDSDCTQPEHRDRVLPAGDVAGIVRGALAMLGARHAY